MNPLLEVDQYPIPTPKQLFSALAGGEKFTRLDLANAYQQIPLDMISRDRMTLQIYPSRIVAEVAIRYRVRT